MARGRRRGRRRGLPKTVGGWVGLSMKAIGAATALGPAIYGVTSNIGNPTNIPASVIYNYTGFNITAGTGGGVNYQQLATGVTAVGLGIVIAKLGSMAARIIH